MSVKESERRERERKAEISKEEEEKVEKEKEKCPLLLLDQHSRTKESTTIPSTVFLDTNSVTVPTRF